MPTTPKKPCAYPNCPRLTHNRYCDEHKPKTKRSDVYKQRYSSEWNRIRKRYVMLNPFCEQCFAKGIIRKVDEVHHKIPLAEGGTHDENNLISLCKKCHAKIHGERGDYKDGKEHQVYTY